jgi:hypothetical protein
MRTLPTRPRWLATAKIAEQDAVLHNFTLNHGSNRYSPETYAISPEAQRESVQARSCSVKTALLRVFRDRHVCPDVGRHRQRTLHFWPYHSVSRRTPVIAGGIFMTKSNSEASRSGERKHYSTPTLKVYGEVVQLTAGGSLAVDETATMMCGMNAAKRCTV